MADFTETELSGGGWTSDGIERSIPYTRNDEGSAVLVDAPGDGKRVLLTAYHLVGEGDVGVRFDDDDSNLTGLMDLAANTDLYADSNGRGILAAGENERLILFQSVSAQVSGWIRYTIQTKAGS